MIRNSILFLFIISFLVTHAQNTVGLIKYDLDQVSEGYNLIFPHNQSKVYLLNNCGQVVHTWNDTLYRPGNAVYLRENGDLYKAISRGPASNPVIHAGGGGEGLEIRAWDNTLKWRWFYNDSTQRLHHDFAVMSNGNILAIAWERKDSLESIAQGRDTALIPDREVWPDKIIEVKPIGVDSAEIVWEWHAWDHLVQDFDTNKPNYGAPKDHIELIDINYGTDDQDWLHANSIDFNEELNQILLSVPTFNEIWIIDHSTTTAQAAGHSGGVSGRGGDLLFRWGNPEAYGRGKPSTQKLFYQHDAHWIDGYGLDATELDFGKIMVYNNRISATQSNVNVIDPVFNSYDRQYELVTDSTYEPLNFDWTYATRISSRILSSAQRLPNGNTLISSGILGYSFEINEQDSIIWEYITPLSSGNPVPQGTFLSSADNLTFRMKRYPENFAAFSGRNLSPKGYIELNPTTNFCTLVNSIAESVNPSSPNPVIFPNPVQSTVGIQSSNGNRLGRVIIRSSTGKVLFEADAGQYLQVDVSDWSAGVYFVYLEEGSVGKLIKQ